MKSTTRNNIKAETAVKVSESSAEKQTVYLHGMLTGSAPCDCCGPLSQMSLRKSPSDFPSWCLPPPTSLQSIAGFVSKDSHQAGSLPRMKGHIGDCTKGVRKAWGPAAWFLQPCSKTVSTSKHWIRVNSEKLRLTIRDMATVSSSKERNKKHSSRQVLKHTWLILANQHHVTNF